jgi:hypothetical protein
MFELSFLLVVGGLVAGTLAARILILTSGTNDLPPMPSEH